MIACGTMPAASANNLSPATGSSTATHSEPSIRLNCPLQMASTAYATSAQIDAAQKVESR